MVQKIKHGCGFKKVGHAGTLDPLAEGVLIVLTDADTKRQDEFMGMKKEYLVKIAFGYESDSHDLGTPIRLFHKEVSDVLTRDILEDILQKYIGKIKQQVPAYSAVHVAGQRLYKVARDRTLKETTTEQNIESVFIKLPYKEIEIYDIKVCSFNSNEVLDYPINYIEQVICTIAELKVICGKGTYIRSLVRDIGKDLNYGAVATSLIRTKVGDYSIEDGLTIDKVLLKHLKS